MIYFSFSSVLTAVFVSGLLLALISLLFRSEETLVKIGYKVMAVFCIVIFVRLLFPYELPFTKTVLFPASISNPISLLRHRHEIIPGFAVSVSDVLLVVWLAGSIVSFAALFIQHRKLRTIILSNSKDVTGKEPYASILDQLCPDKARKGLCLRTSVFVDSPMILGLRKTIILLPQESAPTDENLLYALRHELQHYRYHDLWLRSLIRGLSAFYWWIPFCHTLNSQVGTLLEIRVDAAIVSDGDEATAKYISTLLHYVQNTKEHMNPYMGLTLNKKSSLEYRIHMIHNRNKKPNMLISGALLLLVFGLYFGSYLFVFENSSYDDSITKSENYIHLDANNSYAISNVDGSYTIYIYDGQYTEIVDSLEYYPDIIVYSSKEEHDETFQENQ